MSNSMEFLNLPARPRPRKKGLTVLFEYFLPIARVQSMLEVASEALDYAKFVHAGIGLGKSLPKGWMEKKTELYRAHGVKTYLGGVPYQVAIVQGAVDKYFDWVKSVGFDGLEIAEDASMLWVWCCR